MDAGPRFDKTYSRVPDRYPLLDDADAAPGSSRFTKTYHGAVWRVNHKLLAKTLLLDFWIDKTVNPNPHYISVVQEDLNNITITWDSVAAGRVCIYRCLERDVFTRSFAQEIPATTWTFTHDLGTEALLADCWVDGQLQDSSCISISETEVTCTFDEECTGIVCLLLADPDVNPQFLVYWNGILGRPDVFPPAQHNHTDANEITKASDSIALGGKLARDYVLKNTIGTEICPLNADGEIPLIYMPRYGKLHTTSKSGDFDRIVTQFQVDNVNSNLFFVFDSLSNTAILRQYPVIKSFVVSGNVIYPVSNAECRVEASAEFDCHLIIGDNLKATIVDRHTVRLDVPSVGTKIFTKSGVFSDTEEWEFEDSIFNIPGKQLIQLHERKELLEEIVDETEHIINHTDINIPFVKFTPELPVSINDSVISSKLRHHKDHIWWEEQVSTNVIFTGWATLCGCFYDSSLNTYLFMDYLNGNYRWHSFDMSTENIVFMRAIPMDEISGIMDIFYGQLYSVTNDNGKVKLRKTPFLTLPVTNWTDICTFDVSTYPDNDSIYDVKLRFSGRYLFMYVVSTRVLTVWDTQNPDNPPTFEDTMTVPISNFVIWPDLYVSYCYGEYTGSTNMGFVTSDKPLTDYTAQFNHSNVELFCGTCNYMAMDTTLPVVSGFAIREDGKFVWAKKIFQDAISIYSTGNAEIMTRIGYTLCIPPSIAKAKNFTPKSLIIPTGVSVKIAFSLLPFVVKPDTLYIWTGSTFSALPISNFPMAAQDLSVLDTLFIRGGNIIYYYLFITQIDSYAYFEFDQRWEYTIESKGVYAPLPINTHGIPTIDVTMPAGSIKIINKMGRDVLDLNLVVYNA